MTLSVTLTTGESRTKIIDRRIVTITTMADSDDDFSLSEGDINDVLVEMITSGVLTRSAQKRHRQCTENVSYSPPKKGLNYYQTSNKFRNSKRASVFGLMGETSTQISPLESSKPPLGSRRLIFVEINKKKVKLTSLPLLGILFVNSSLLVEPPMLGS